MAELTDIREIVRKRYADAASAATRGSCEDARALKAEAGCCGPSAITCSPADETGVFGAGLYEQSSRGEVPDAAINASLGCGVPTAVAGGLTEAKFRRTLRAAGFDEIEICPTHKVHEHASSAIIRAREPPTADCCDQTSQATCCEPADKNDCCGESHAAGACGCQPAP